jgi:hypothetical protein
MRLLLFLLFSASLSAQPVFFEKIYGTGGSDQARSVKQISTGSIFVAGFSDSGAYGGIDASLSKLDRAGNLLWIKYYGDANDNFGLWLNKTTDGNLVLCGERQSNNGTQVDGFAYKIDTSGNVIWNKIYATPVNESFKYIEQTNDGGYILCGFQNDQYGFNDTYVMKTNAAGDSTWAITIGSIDNEYSDAVHQLADGTYLVTGDTRSQGAGGYDVEVTRLDANGQQLWDFPYGDQFQNGCQGIFLNSSGKYISFGETVIFTNSPFDFYFEQIDTAGTSQWRQTFGGANADAIFSIVQMPDKGYLFTGYSNSYSTGPLNLVVGKTDSLAALQWIRVYGGTGIDIGYEVIHAVDGGVLVAGTTNDSITFDAEYYLLHLDNAGLLSGIDPLPHSTGLSLFPNPTPGDFRIRGIENEVGLQIKIYSANGQLVHQERLIAKNDEISLGAGVPAGIYFAEVSDGTVCWHSKLVVMGK